MVSDSLSNSARELAAAIRAGLLPIPGTARDPVLNQLAATADLPVWIAANRTPATGLFGHLRPIPGAVRGPLRIAAAGGAPHDLITALGRGFGIQQSRRWSRNIVLISTLAISGLAVIGMLVLVAINAPLIDQQRLLQTGVSQSNSAFLAAAFGPTPVAMTLAAIVLGAGIGLSLVMLSSRRRLDFVLARWIASEAHEALAQTRLSDPDRQAIVHELLSDWCWIPPANNAGPSGLLELALADESPRKTAAVARAVGFHRRRGDLLQAEQSRLIPVLGSLTAGLAVLLYGIALMRPMAALFDTLATAPVVTLWEATR